MDDDLEVQDDQQDEDWYQNGKEGGGSRSVGHDQNYFENILSIIHCTVWKVWQVHVLG